MNVEEIKEGAEHAHEAGQKKIGLTMAITAVFLAVATLLSHRAHTEEGLLQGKIVDDWSFYQAKHGRAHQYGEIAEVAALLPNGKELALRDYKKSVEEECGSPVEEGCSSPQKNSPVLRALLAETAEAPQEKSKEPEHGKKSPDAKAEAPGAAEKPEHKAAPAKQGAVHIQEQAREREKEQELIKRQANYYDAAELFLEVAIVLCSISLLAGNLMFWRFSFVTTAIGVGVVLWGLLALH